MERTPLVMRSFYVDAARDARLDEVAYRSRVKKSEYVRRSLAFAVELLEHLEGRDRQVSAEAFSQELERALQLLRDHARPGKRKVVKASRPVMGTFQRDDKLEIGKLPADRWTVEEPEVSYPVGAAAGAGASAEEEPTPGPTVGRRRQREP